MKIFIILAVLTAASMVEDVQAFILRPCLSCGTYQPQQSRKRLAVTTLASPSTISDTIYAASTDHHKIMILGGGTGGCGVAAQLLNEGVLAKDICILEPATTHYYQPLWTMVGAGIFDVAVSARPMSSTIPNGVTWLRDSAIKVAPDDNQVQCASGRKLSYDYLVVATGLQCDWDKVPGLAEALVDHEKTGVCSNYHPQYAQNTWRVLEGLRNGSALFTQPKTPVKCGGAPQKIMWLTDDYLRRQNRRGDVDIHFVLPQKVHFGVSKYAEVLKTEATTRDIDFMFETTLVSVDGVQHRATFRRLSDGSEFELPFAMLHVTPPMSAPDFLKGSPLANEQGFVAVDKYTTQHITYPNVFSLGDSSSLPTSKTMAAITGEAPVLTHNLLRVMQGKRPTAEYDGFTSCPIVLGYGKLLMTEFVYDCIPQESFTKIPLPFLDQGKPSYFYFLVKKYVFPFVYWNLFMKGRWFGSKLVFKPDFSEVDRRADEEYKKNAVARGRLGEKF